MSVPANPDLYRFVVAEAKQKFDVYPSAYASGYIVRRYKQLGGSYLNKRKQKPLDRWYKEKWINVCELPDIVPCGRSNKNVVPKDYPYCRPSVRVDENTPNTVYELSPSELKRRCALKRIRPFQRLLV